MSSKSLYFGPRHDIFVKIWPLNQFGLPMAGLMFKTIKKNYTTYKN